jgi:twitching motility protein PilU
VNTSIPDFEGLGLPAVLGEIASHDQGIIILAGVTGSGKSTTIASMLQYVNTRERCHIVTIEDPIEFVHPHSRSIVSQREVGTDCESYAMALRDAPRQAPDVILIGEIRDEESAAVAVHFAETGHLVLSTLHSSNASQTLERLFGFFPSDRHAGIALQLSLNVAGIISQRLVSRADGDGLVAAVEIMISTPRVRELLQKIDLNGLRSVMQSPPGIREGMQTFDYALYQLVQDGLVDPETAMTAADSPNDLRLRLKGLL